jgi:hypothetical protein
MKTNDVQDILTLSTMIDAAQDKTELIAGLCNWRDLAVQAATVGDVQRAKVQENVAAQRKPIEDVADDIADEAAEDEDVAAEDEPEPPAPPVKKAAAKKVSPPAKARAKPPAKPAADDDDF